MPLIYDDAASFSDEKPKRKSTSSSNLDAFLESEGATHLKPVVEAIYGQESGSGRTHATSVDGARGQMQVIPATFNRLAREGERIDNPDDNMRVGIRYIKQLGDKFGNDPARIATGYFSGEGNVAPSGDTPYKADRADGNKKTVSSYVKEVMGRIGNAVIPSAQAETQPATAIKKVGDYPTWAEVTAKPEYQALKPEEQDAARRQYFMDNVVPQLSADQVRDAWGQFDAETKPKEVGLLDKAKKAAGWNEGLDFKRPEGMTEDTFSAGVPEGQVEPKRLDSVMAGHAAEAIPAIEYRGAPVDEATYRQLKNIYDAGGIRREALLARSDWRGDVGRAIQKSYGAESTGVARKVDPRIEARKAELVADGAHPDTAANIAKQAALAGVVPGTEAPGSITESELDKSWGDGGSLGKVGAFASGSVGSMGAMLSDVGRRGGLGDVAALGDAMQNWSARKMPTNPTFADEVVNGFGSMSSFFIPGLGVARGAEALAILSPALAKWAGAGTMAALEAAAESDQTYKTLLKQGHTDASAAERANTTFLQNLALLGVTDKLGFFNDLKGLGAKVLTAKLTEGTQEGGQQVIQNLQTDQAAGEGVGKAAALGAIVGGGSAALQHGAGVAMDKLDPTGAALRDLNETVDGTQFAPLDRPTGRDGFVEGSRVGPDGKINWGAKQQQPAGETRQQPAAVADDPLGASPLSNPIAGELAGFSSEHQPDAAPGQSAPQPTEGAENEQGQKAEVLIGGRPASQHTPASLQFLANTHPDPAVRDLATLTLQQKQAELQHADPELDALVQRATGDTGARAVPETALPATRGSGEAGVTSGEATLVRAILDISGREPVWYSANGAEGFVLPERDTKRVFLNARKGAIAPLATAGHEVFHLVETEAPDLVSSFRSVVDRVSNIDLSTDDGLLAYAQTYAPAVFRTEALAGKSAKEALDALIPKIGEGYTRDMIRSEFYNDVFGNRWSEPGFYKSLVKELARTDIGLLGKFKAALDLVVQKVQGLGGNSFEADKFLKDIEPVRQEAARVYAAYASRQSHREKIGKMTPAELLLTKKANPDEVVRDLAEMELKRREVEGAYAEREKQQDQAKAQKEKEKDATRAWRQKQDQEVEQAAAESRAAGFDEPRVTALEAALAGAKKDIQSLRRQMAKEMKKAAATARGQAQVRQDVLEDNEQGRFSPDRTGNKALPTRWPTAVGSKATVYDPMLADLETLRENQTQLDKAVAALAAEPGMRSKARTTEGKLAEILDKMVSNLLWLHDQVPAEIRDRSKLWYDGAGAIASKWADKYGKARSQTAGILAVLSPQKDWFMNVTMGERVLDILSSQLEHRFDGKMRGAAFQFLVKEWSKSPDKRNNMAAFEAAKDKTLHEVIESGDLLAAGIWLRAYDEAYHDPRHAVVHPEGDFGENATTGTGTETLRAWGDFKALGKAASIFLDGSLDNINDKLGGEHKVRNFYNNIFNPKDARFTTIDTHAVAADLLRPLAGADKAVTDNFGKTGSSNMTGVSGTYPIHYEVYKRAAEARDILPREMQSITWEAVRGLFTEGFKGKKDNLAKVDSIWREVDKGKLAVEQARQEILKMAGGIEHPDWWGGSEPNAQSKDKSYSQDRPVFSGNKIVFEVAPDPHNKELTARWNALSEKTKAEISNDIAWDMAGQVLAFYNTDTIKGEIHRQVGGYLDETNPSFSLWMNKYASMTKIQEIAHVLGYILNQDSMVIGSPKKFKGGTEMGYVRVTGVSDTNAKMVYDELRAAIRDKDGSALINGHTTAEGSMVILVPQGTEEDTHNRVIDKLGDRHDVGFGTTFVQWPERGENDYGFTGQAETRGSGAEPSVRALAHNLRREAAAELEKRITSARLSPGRGHERSGGGRVDPGRSGQGDQRLGRVDVTGTHFSREQRAHLTGGYFGTGLKGAEADRIRAATDSRLKSRLYAYINEGQGVFPEAGVGAHAHTVKFNNLYDIKADPLGIRQKTRDENERESLILDAGFDGYYAPGVFGRQGVAVLMGKAALQGVTPSKTEAPIQKQEKTQAAARRTDLPLGRMTGAEWKALEPRATDLEDDKLYYRDAVRFSPDRFQAIADAFAKRAGEALANPRNTRNVLIHSNTPASLQILGWSDRQLLVEPGELAKIASKPGFETDDKIGNLVLDLARPGAMFWNEKQGSLNILRREDMRGAPALIAVRPDIAVERGRYHLMVTAHRLENQEALLRKIMSGELKSLYLDQANPLIKAAMQKKRYRVGDTAESLAPENLHARGSVQLGMASRLLSEGDLVKWEQDNWGDTPKFSPARVQSEYGLPDQQPGNRTLDGAELKALRRAAARLERPEAGITFRITEDGAAVATGPKGVRVPERYLRFANDNGLTFEARRLPLGSGTKAPAMPDEHREAGALYFGEMMSARWPIDRTGMTRFSPARAQTETPEFKRWFGDSKVVDENGDPLVVYHGTSGDFSVFDGGKSGSNFSGADSGFYFTNNANDVYIKDSSASAYAANAASTGGAANIIPAYVSLKNPLVVEKEMPGGPVKFADENRDGLRQQAKRGEHDGIILRDTGSELLSRDGLAETVFIAFRPEQIKSAIGNNGQFDPANPDIRYSPPRAQTETPEFKKWFGEWDHPKAFTSKFPADKTPPSQAMDWENNRPLVLFHATNGDFNAFETGRESVTSTTFGPVETRRHAIFTTPDVKFAESYLKKGGGQNVMPIYMDIKAPMDLRNNGAWDYVDELVKNGFENHRWPNRSDTEMWEMFDDEMGEAFVSAAKQAGYDGAIMFEVDDNDKMVEVYVAFDPAQIKSAIGNNGQFDPGNADIRYSPSRWYYSQLQRAFADAPARVFGPAAQVKAWLASNASKLGIKQDEVQWSGINEWLDMQGKAKVSKEDVVEYLQQNGVRIAEVKKKDFGFDEDNPSLPPGQGLEVIPFDQLNDEQVAELGARGNRNDYAVVNADGEVVGLGSTEDEAVFDTYSGYPEYWKAGTKYGEYTLPGSTNYRELLLTLPTKAPLSKRYVVEGQGPGATLRDTKTGFRITQGNYGRMVEMAMVKNAEDAGQAKPFKSGHWEEANILAHIRFNDRTDADGAKVLFIEELQSDWAQRGREEGFGAHVAPTSKRPSLEERTELLRDIRKAAAEEFVRRTNGGIDADTAREIANKQPLSFVAQTAGREAEWNDLLKREQEWDTYDRKKPVPTGPFVGKTEAWVDLALKRMVAYAVENGYDKVAIVNGQQSAERYDLSKQVDAIAWQKQPNGTFNIQAIRGEEEVTQQSGLSLGELEAAIGKDAASKIEERSADKDMGTLRGLDLKVGGEGMTAFYDKIVPQRVREVLKKLGGGKLETVRIPLPSDIETDQVYKELSGDDGFVTARSQPGFSITPAMRDRVAEGLPLFSPMRKVADAVNNTLARIDAAVDGLSNLPDQFDYLSDRYLALGKIARVDEIIKEIRGTFDGMPQADKAAVYAYLTTRGASVSMIGNPEGQVMAKRVKDVINYVGDALVARGLLDPASRAHYKDQYLPRIYLKHLMNDADWKMLGGGKKPTDMGYLKERKDIAPEIRELVLGEIKDPSFLAANAVGRAMRDVALLDWMGKISQHNDWVYPGVFVDYRGQRVTSYWLKAEADRIEAQIPHYTPANQAKAKQLVADMRQAASAASLDHLDHTLFKQIPDTIRYGMLRGMWLRKEIYNDIMGASQIINADPTWFEDWFGFGGKGTRLTQWWKFSKVALNPPGQVRNFVSNMVMLQLSGVGLHKLPFRLIQAANEIIHDGRHWKVAKKYGVTESTFTAQELFRVKRDLLSLENSTGKMNPLSWLTNAGVHFLDKVSNLYQFSEALGKVIKIIDEMENGKTEAEAAVEAQKWLFDYSLVPQSVRIARNSPVGLPFITYQVKVLPRLLEVAAKHPWRFLPWVGLLYGMQAYVASLFGVDDDDLKKLKKSLPQWLQDRGHTVFLPNKDADGRLQVADVGYFFPWSFYTQVGKHAAAGEMEKALMGDIGGQFSAPIIGAGAALMANYDTFTKKPIYNKSDPVSYQAAAIANYTYDLMAPPFISSHGFASPMGLFDKQYGGKMVQAVTGTTNKFGDPRATAGQAIAGLLGFNFYGMDPEHTRATNLQQLTRKVQEAELQLKTRMFDRSLTAEQRAKYMTDYRERMIELGEEAKKYAEESAVPEQLKVRK